MMDEALYRITTPKQTSRSTVANRIQSVLRRCGILFLRRKRVHDFLENFTAVFEAAELVETGASGRQQYGIAGSAVAVAVPDGSLQRSGLDQRHGAVESAADLRGRGANQQDGPGLGGQGLSQRGVVEALVIAAQDQPDSAPERVERLQRGVDAGGFGVVIEIDAAEVADELESMFDGAEFANGVRNRLMADSRARDGERSGKHVFDIVAAADRYLAGVHQRLPEEDQLVAAKACARLYVLAAAEPLGDGRSALGVSAADGVVGIEHGEIARLLRFEQAALGGGVPFEGAVAVEVVLCDVEADTDVGAEFADGFKLKAGELEHVPAVLAGGRNHPAHGGADIASHLNGQTGFAENVAGEAGRGGFAVGAGE